MDIDSPDPGMTEIISGLLSQFKGLWWSLDSNLPDLGKYYTRKDKREKESILNHTIDNLFKEVKSIPDSTNELKNFEDRILVLLSNAAKIVFGINEQHISIILSTGILDATREFIRQARKFDPEISVSDIYQASRNAWTMNLLQLLFNIPVQVTPALVGYSLLYPYTDNYLDDPKIAVEEKYDFNLRFLDRLKGTNIIVDNVKEEKIYDLISLIESQYKRDQYSQVYDSLLAIYQAQSNSIGLLNRWASPYEIDVLGLTFEKGGTSVLADGYLVAGKLTSAQRELTFHYGSFTQLMDDLEDIEGDHRAGLLTIFSQMAKRWPLDQVSSRTFNYGSKMLDRMEGFNTPALEPLFELLRMALYPLLIDSISQASRFYTRAYLKKLETFYPFQFRFRRKMHRRLTRRINRDRVFFDRLLRMVG